MLKILITGSSGQLGREWSGFLRQHSGRVDVRPLSSGQLDICSRTALFRELEDWNPDIVINCAAYTDVDGAEEDSERAFAVNETGVKNLSEWCAEHARLIVHFSTDYIFPGLMRDRERYPKGYPEEAPTDPVNLYGASKLAGESALQESGAPYLIIRTSWLCGIHGSNFIRTMLRLADEREQIRVVDDQFGSPSFTRPLVANSWNLIDKGATGIFHSTSSGETTWYGFAREIFDQAGKGVDLRPVSSSGFPMKAKRPAFSKLSTDKLASVHGSELIDWKAGLKDFLRQV